MTDTKATCQPCSKEQAIDQIRDAIVGKPGGEPGMLEMARRTSEIVQRHDKAIYGNGKIGLIDRVQALADAEKKRADAEAVVKDAKKSSDNFRMTLRLLVIGQILTFAFAIFRDKLF